MDKCIKVRILTGKGWKDCRMKAKDGDVYVPVEGYDSELIKDIQDKFEDVAWIDSQDTANTVEGCNFGAPLEVIAQYGDEFPV